MRQVPSEPHILRKMASNSSLGLPKLAPGHNSHSKLAQVKIADENSADVASRHLLLVEKRPNASPLHKFTRSGMIPLKRQNEALKRIVS